MATILLVDDGLTPRRKQFYCHVLKKYTFRICVDKFCESAHFRLSGEVGMLFICLLNGKPVIVDEP